MIDYIWKFPSFDCIINKDGLQTIITTVYWILTGTDEDNISATIYGSQPVGQPNPETFTPFPEISKEQVIGWMESSMNVDALKENLAIQIDLIKNPITEVLPAPWDTQ